MKASISRNSKQPTICSCLLIGQTSPPVLEYPLAGITDNSGIASHDLARQLQMPKNPQGWRQDLRLLQPARRREKRSEGNLQASLFDEGAAGKPLAQRRRAHRQEGRHSRSLQVAEEARARA